MSTCVVACESSLCDCGTRRSKDGRSASDPRLRVAPLALAGGRLYLPVRIATALHVYQVRHPRSCLAPPNPQNGLRSSRILSASHRQATEVSFAILCPKTTP